MHDHMALAHTRFTWFLLLLFKVIMLIGMLVLTLNLKFYVYVHVHDHVHVWDMLMFISSFLN